MRRVPLVGCATLCLFACGSADKPDEHVQAATKNDGNSTARLPPANLKPPPPPADDTGHSVMIRFAGDDLAQCVDIKMTEPHRSTINDDELNLDQAAAALGNGLIGDKAPDLTSTTMKLVITRSFGALTHDDWKPCDDGKCEDVKPVFDELVQPKTRAKVVESLRKLGAGTVKGVTFVDACPDRAALGTCIESDQLPVLTWTATIRYYDVASTIDSDRSMKRCLAFGGNWKAIPDDSLEAMDARVKQHSAFLRR